MEEKRRLILEILQRHGGEMYGLQIVKSSSGQLKRGTIYVHLDRLELSGLVTSRQETRIHPDVKLPRRLYKISESGHRQLAEDDLGDVALAFGR